MSVYIYIRHQLTLKGEVLNIKNIRQGLKSDKLQKKKGEELEKSQICQPLLRF